MKRLDLIWVLCVGFGAALVPANMASSPLFYGDSFKACQKDTSKCRWGTCLLCKKQSCGWGRFVGNVLYDVAEIHKNLIDVDTFKMISTFFPMVSVARAFDRSLHHGFYDRFLHRNRNQPPQWSETVAKISISLPIVGFGLRAFFEDDAEFAITTRFLLLGMPFVIWSKEILKTMEFEICKRPWNENFSSKKQAYGGFPSGHMAEATYTALLYGMRYGGKYGVPLGALAAFIAGTFLACNRHYLSQVIAGAGLGTVYAIAADKVIDTRLRQRNVEVGVGYSRERGATVNFGMKF